ncbi:unnamed protein product, partial [Ectocarpus sp. 12 AP-2014]
RRSTFSCGKLGDVYIPRDMRTGEPRGFAFVRYLDKRDADDAVDRLDGTRFNGRELRIQVRGGYGGGGGHYDRGGGGGGRDDRRGGRSRSPRRRSRSVLRKK